MTAPTLVEWLLTQLAVDEDSRSLVDLAEVMRHRGSPLVADFLMEQRGRQLAEVAAKRRIMELHDPPCPECAIYDGAGCRTLRILVSVFGDAPGFRDEWRL